MYICGFLEEPRKTPVVLHSSKGCVHQQRSCIPTNICGFLEEPRKTPVVLYSSKGLTHQQRSCTPAKIVHISKGSGQSSFSCQERTQTRSWRLRPETILETSRRSI